MVPQFNDKSIVFVLIALTVVAAGCANLNYASPVDAAASADRSKAYLYGRFRLFEGSDTAMRLSIELRNLDTLEVVNVRFNKRGSDVYAIAVAPSMYRIAHLLLAPPGPVSERAIHRQPLSLPSPQGIAFEVQAGRAYYVGDYVAAVSIDSEYYFAFWKTTTRWKLYEASLKYDETTREFKQLYRLFDAIEASPAWQLPAGSDPLIPSLR